MFLRRCTTTHTRRRGFSSKPQVVGFIGIGQMGHNMAFNLSNSPTHAPAKLVLFDTNTAAVSRLHDLVPHNTVPASSIPDLTSQCSVIITMLPTPAVVKHVYLDMIKPALIPGTLLIDCSTIDPSTSKLIASELPTAQVLDAPVSGGVIGAVNASLTFMCGGSMHTLDRATPVLHTMGKNIVHCGPNGNGQIAKICNNMILGSTMVAVSESLVLGKKLGLDLHVLNSIINTSTGRCWVSEKYNPVPGFLESSPASRGYIQGFSLALQQKDLGLGLDAAESVEASVPMATAANQVLNDAMNVPKLKNLDIGIIYQWLLGEWNKFGNK